MRAVNAIEKRVVQRVEFLLCGLFDFEIVSSHAAVRVSNDSRGIARKEFPFHFDALQK